MGLGDLIQNFWAKPQTFPHPASATIETIEVIRKKGYDNLQGKRLPPNLRLPNGLVVVDATYNTGRGIVHLEVLDGRVRYDADATRNELIRYNKTPSKGRWSKDAKAVDYASLLGKLNTGFAQHFSS